MPRHAFLIERLKDPENALAYITVALEEVSQTGKTKPLLMALRNVAEAQGGMSELADRTGLNRQSLYKSLSSDGNPRLNTLLKIMKALSFQLTIDRF